MKLLFMPKMEAHRKGVLHRAFSVFIFNSSRLLLMQKRSDQKYHSPGLWTNTCCSHQRDGESTKDAANRRLMEEMGLCVDMHEIFSFIYKANLKNSLIEHEYDHVSEYDHEHEHDHAIFSYLCAFESRLPTAGRAFRSPSPNPWNASSALLRWQSLACW